MKKFFKFLLGVGALAGACAAGFACYKKFVAKNDEDDFDDFEDDLEEDDEDDDDSREYVSINITSDEDKKEEPATED